MSAPRCEPPEEWRDRDGWHWVSMRGWKETPLLWMADEQRWSKGNQSWSSEHAAYDDWRYHSPVATPAEVEALRAELERERMRLAACGVVALADTPESAARARDMHADYRSASCDDVARTVDALMALRARVVELKEALKTYQTEQCEGFCLEDKNWFGDCAGCVARVALERKP